MKSPGSPWWHIPWIRCFIILGAVIFRVNGQACHQPHQPGFEATCGFAMGCTILGTFGIASDTSPIGRWTSTSAESWISDDALLRVSTSPTSKMGLHQVSSLKIVVFSKFAPTNMVCSEQFAPRNTKFVRNSPFKNAIQKPGFRWFPTVMSLASSKKQPSLSQKTTEAEAKSGDG